MDLQKQVPQIPPVQTCGLQPHCWCLNLPVGLPLTSHSGHILKNTDKDSRDKLENNKKKLSVVKEQNHDGSDSGWKSHALSIEKSSEEESEHKNHEDDCEELSSNAKMEEVEIGLTD